MLRLLLRALYKLMAPLSAAIRPDVPPSFRVVGLDETDPAPATEAAADGEAPVRLPFKPADPPNRPAA
jgi:hypothetical protein